MNNLKLTIIFASLLALASCSNEEINENNNTNTWEENEVKADDSITQKSFDTTYIIPDWEEQVTFDVEFKENWEIVSAVAESNSKSPVTAGYIKKFNDWTANRIVWKKITDVPADIVNWASEITKAFINTVKEWTATQES